MNGTRIEVVAPLERAWRRAQAFLFRPFEAKRWLVVGFGAWLARMGSCGLGGSIPTPPSGGGGGGDGVVERTGGAAEGAGEAFAWLAAHAPVLIAAALTLALFVLAWIGVLMWLQARGSFVFLDNVAFRRAEILDPFVRHARQADSAFLWKVGFGAVVLAAVLLVAVPMVVVAIGAGGGPAVLAAILVTMPLILLIALAAAVIGLLFDSFVVPIMLLHRLRAMAAWRRLLPLVRAHAGSFALYALFVLVLAIGFGMALMVAGLATCCVGFLVLAIPYLGTVVLLPAWATYRAYSLEFLAQFGPEYDLLAAPPPAGPPIPAALQ